MLAECRTVRCAVAPFTVPLGKVTELARRKKVPAAFYCTEMGTDLCVIGSNRLQPRIGN